MVLGYELMGSGSSKVIILHDWFCDHTSYEGIKVYLNQQNFEYAFVDLRGYGASQELQGEYSLEEATQDILETADELGWDRFHLIGYSMSALVGQNIAATTSERVQSLIAVCPVSAEGLPGITDDLIQFMTDAAQGDKEKALQIAHMLTSNRHDDAWAHYKVERWWQTSKAEARIGYMLMFAKNNIVEKVKGLSTPIMVVCTSDDGDVHRRPVMEATFGQWFPRVRLMEISNAGHYPMQETPVSLATLINRFLWEQR